MDDVKLLTTLKILIIGESNVGKSRYAIINCFISMRNQWCWLTYCLFNCLHHSLLLRFIDDEFDPEQSLTIGVDFKTKIVNIDDNHVKLGKFETADSTRICDCVWINVCFFIQACWDTAGQERFRTLTPSYYRCDITWLHFIIQHLILTLSFHFLVTHKAQFWCMMYQNRAHFKSSNHGWMSSKSMEPNLIWSKW